MSVSTHRFCRRAERIKVACGYNPNGSHFENALLGVLQALREDVKNNRLKTFEELVHASVFDDLLEQAEHLYAKNYLRAAAVIAGCVLEEHLRKLAAKHGIDTHKPSGDAENANTLNTKAYKKAGAYGKTDQSQVTTWLQLRNEAAHPDKEFDKHAPEEIDRMIQGIRGFISRLPA